MPVRKLSSRKRTAHRGPVTKAVLPLSLFLCLSVCLSVSVSVYLSLSVSVSLSVLSQCVCVCVCFVQTCGFLCLSVPEEQAGLSDRTSYQSVRCFSQKRLPVPHFKMKSADTHVSVVWNSRPMNIHFTSSLSILKAPLQTRLFRIAFPQ